MTDIFDTPEDNFGLMLKSGSGEICALATSDSYNYPMVIKVEYE